MRIAENFQGLNDRKAREAMQRAFAISLGIAPSDDARRQRVQILEVSAAASVHLRDAMEMMKQIELVYAAWFDPRQAPIGAIVSRLIEICRNRTFGASKSSELLFRCMRCVPLPRSAIS